MSKSVWMRDAEGAYAYVPSDQVDTWIPRGLKEADEPADDTTFVWMHNAEIDGRAKFAAGVLDQWKPRGWEPSTPPEPVSLLKDPVLTDVKDSPRKPAAKKTTADKQES